jgi:hypothetical protein
MRSHDRRPRAAAAGQRLAKALAVVAVTFTALTRGAAAGAAPTPAPRLQIAPAADLAPGAQVAFVGAGFAPGVALRIEECSLTGPEPDPARCTAIADSLLLAAPDGTVRGTATIVTGPVGSAPDAVCPAAPPRACSVWLVASGAGGSTAGAPIAFSPGVAVAPPPPAPATAPATAPPVTRPSVAPTPVTAPPVTRPSVAPTPVTAPPVTRPSVAPTPVTALPRPTPAPPAATPQPLRTRTATHTSTWTFGLVGLVMAGLVAGVGRARLGLRRMRRERRLA